jgi:hypothetical protein
LSVVGCAAVSGLDQLNKDDCAFPGSCADAIVDVTVDAPVDRVTFVPDHAAAEGPDDTTTPPEGAASDDATGDDMMGDGMMGDARPTDARGEDPPADAPAADSAADVVEAGGKDAAAEADSGCGPLNTITNCGACGQSCASASSSTKSPTCGPGPGGESCSYTCTAGNLDCNASLAPNTDGCECATPGVANAKCCSSSCPIKHSYNTQVTGSTFYDCVPAGIINQTLAMDACAAFTGDPAQCSSGACINPVTDAGNGDMVVCADGPLSNDCMCWTYAGPNKGFVNDPKLAPNNCLCSAGNVGDPTFN